MVQPKDESIITDGVEAGDLNMPAIGGLEDKEGNILTGYRYYTSFTVAGNAQTNDRTWINLCGTKPLGQENILAEKTPEEEAAFYNALVGDVVITCTVEYTDGSVQTAQIGLTGRTATYGELGIAETAEWENYEDAFIVYEMK